MRQQAMAERMIYNRPIPANRLVSSIADSTKPMYWILGLYSNEFLKRRRLILRSTGVDLMVLASS